jgi:hypothetical protein
MLRNHPFLFLRLGINGTSFLKWLNENGMNIAVNTGGVSLPPAHHPGWGKKVRIEHGCGSEKPGFGFEKWLDSPTDGSIFTKGIGKARFEP